MTRISPKTRLLALATLSVLAFAPAAMAQVTYGGSVQGSNGRGATVQGSGGYDATTGTRNRSATVTTNSGQTVSRQVTGDCVRLASGGVDCSKSASTTGANGTTNSTTTHSYANGSGTKTVTRQGPNGNGYTRQRWITVNP